MKRIKEFDQTEIENDKAYFNLAHNENLINNETSLLKTAINEVHIIWHKATIVNTQ